MAEVILSPVIQVVSEALMLWIHEGASGVWGVKQELESLSSTLSTIKSVLDDAEEKQVQEKSVRDWLLKLKFVAYQVDDIVDDCEIHERITKIRRAEACNFLPRVYLCNFLPRLWFRNVGKVCVSVGAKVTFHCSIGHRIRGINEKLTKIAEERSKFHLREGISEKKVEIRETGSFVDESTVLGREDDKQNIIKLLLASNGECGRGDVSVIPIVGMGGLGKTTLAQFVYNDEMVEKHFQQLRMWVCVGEELKIRRVIEMMIESGTGNVCEPLISLDALEQRLGKMLSGRRFLLVLDDVWDEDQHNWERLMHLLRSGAEGSRIIVTTRSEKVSSIMGTTSSICLKGLSDGDCWSLFTERAFRQGMEQVEPNLIAIGKEIVKKCKGVPLAAKTIGSLMHFKRDENEWLQIRDNETWDLREEENGVQNALRISYNHLPPHLKQCFAYCSSYPKDHYIQKGELSKIWIAQGFITNKHVSSGMDHIELEDVCNEYFNDLLQRSFFQDSERDGSGNIGSCKMHDLMHDLAQSIAGNESIVIHVGKSKVIPNQAHHLSLVYNDMAPPTIPKGLYKCRYLRTFLLLSRSPSIFEIPSDLFLHLGCLRALDLSNCGISILPDSIGNLKHLRYLNLRGNSIKNFPETTSNLVMLETLNVEYCGELSNLPKGLKYMKRLKHLEMNDFNSIVSMPSGIGTLLSLRTLPLFIVGIENGCAGLEELGYLNKLRGTLSIRKLENVKSFNRFFQTVLHWKNHLHTLEFCWEGGSGKNNAQEKMVLQGLLPHENLKKLSIKNYGGANFPFWMCSPGCLPNLVSISLEGCSIVESLPPFGKLQFLKELRISGLNEIKYLSEESYGEGNALQGFPSLEKLTLAKMPNLEDWWRSGERYLCGLRELHIVNCPKLRALRQLPKLKELTLHSFDVMMTLEHLPSLEHLHISKCTDLMYLPDELLQDLPTLQSLEILHCHKLVTLPVMIQNLTSLRRLRIQNCPMLMLEERRFQCLTALEELMLGALPNITSLPDSLENLTSLKKLICNCPELRSLPEGLKHLDALEELEIKNGPLLTSRCREGGEDRHKIAHVRRKRIVSNWLLLNLVLLALYLFMIFYWSDKNRE